MIRVYNLLGYSLEQKKKRYSISRMAQPFCKTTRKEKVQLFFFLKENVKGHKGHLSLN